MYLKLTGDQIRERNLQEERYVTVYDYFRPDLNKKYLAPKFYSRHEGKLSEPDPELLKRVIENARPPNEKRMWPETSNQWYGWFDTPLFRKRSYSRLCDPRKATNMTDLVLNLRQEILVRPK